MSKFKVRIVLIIIIAIQIVTMCCWLTKKQGVYQDEMYSFESAHNLRIKIEDDKSYRLTGDGSWYEQWHTLDEFKEHFTVNREVESFLHAPLKDKLYLCLEKSGYMILLNVIMYFTPGEWSFVPPIIVNMVLFAFIQLLLYKMSRYVIDDDWMALIPVLFFGFGAGAVNMVLFVRMYTLNMLYALIVLWMHILLLRENNTIFKIIGFDLIMLFAAYMGYRCQQYMLLWVAGVAGAYMLCIGLQKRWKSMVGYIILFGIPGIAYLSHTNLLKRLLNSPAESNHNKALMALFFRPAEEFGRYIRRYMQMYRDNALGGKFVVIGLSLLFGVLLIVNRKRIRDVWGTWSKKEKQILLMTFISSLFMVMMIARISPDYCTRYLAYCFPATALMVGIIINHFLQNYSSKGRLRICVCVSVAILLSNKFFGHIQFLYEDLAAVKEILQKEEYQIDNIFVNGEWQEYDGLSQIYCDGYMWQEGLRYYSTTSEALREGRCEGLKGYDGEEVLLWIYKEDDQEEIFRYITELTGFDSAVELAETDESMIYYCTRTQ